MKVEGKSESRDLGLLRFLEGVHGGKKAENSLKKLENAEKTGINAAHSRCLISLHMALVLVRDSRSMRFNI